MVKNGAFLMFKALAGVLCFWLAVTTVWAGIPLWAIEPLTATTITVPANGTAKVEYQVTNQSGKVHTLSMRPISGITQVTTGLRVCGNPFVLRSKESCTLSLQVEGSKLSTPVLDGPVICQSGSVNQCYRPGYAHILHLTQTPATQDAVIAVTGSPLMLTVNGVAGQLTVTNTSTNVPATHITSNFTGTALNGQVVEAGNTCAHVPPQGSCVLTYTPDGAAVPQTDFIIQGANTNALTAAIAILPQPVLTAVTPNTGSILGGTSVVLTGDGLTGTTLVTFGGEPATYVNVVSSTEVTAVTPANLVGTVDVVITTPAGSATLTHGYTYTATAIGEPLGGGVVACLNGGFNNLIAANSDMAAVQWGGEGTLTNADSGIDGAYNTSRIVNCLTQGIGCISPPDPLLDEGTYAAGICATYQVDSQGNSPCQPGNSCYADWFLPAVDLGMDVRQLDCLYDNRNAIGGFSLDFYWSSSESSNTMAVTRNFDPGSLFEYELADKSTNTRPIRCVRAL